MISEKLVMGTWGLAGSWSSGGRPMGYGDVPEQRAFELMDAAWSAGIRWADTAAVYGNGEALRRLGEWQTRTGRRFKVVVKVGRPVVEGRPRRCHEWESLLREASTARSLLGEPAALLVKDPPHELCEDGQLSELILNLGAGHRALSGFASTDPAVIAAAPRARKGWIAQIEYHGINARLSLTSAESLHRKGWAVWAMQPLAFGFLASRTGHQGRTFADDDWRSTLPRATRRTFSLAARAFLKRLTSDFPDVPPAQLSIAFCLSDPHVDRVVFGPKTPAHIETAVHAHALSADPAFRASVMEIHRTLKA